MRQVILATMLFSSTAIAGDGMEPRLDFMKLAFACSENPDAGMYRAAFNAATRQAQRDQLPLADVIGLDRSLRDGTVKPDQVEKSECTAKVDAALLSLKSPG